MQQDFQKTQDSVQSFHQDTLNIRQVWHSILERRWLIISIWFSVIVAGSIYAFKAVPIYESSITLQIDPDSAGFLYSKDLYAGGMADQNYVSTQHRNLRSRSLLADVSQALNLKTEDPRYSKSLDEIRTLQADISIIPIRLTRHVEVQVSHTSPLQAQKIANKIGELFLQKNLDDKKQKSLAGFRVLNQEADAKEIELETIQKQLQKYRSDKTMISLLSDQNIDGQTLKDSKSAYEQMRSQSDLASQTAQQAQEFIATGKDISEFGPIGKDEQVSSLRKSINANNTKLAALRTRYRDRHPKVLQILTEIQADTQKVKDESERAYRTLLAEAERVKSLEANSLEKYKESEKKMFTLGDAKVQHDIMMQKMKRVEMIYDTILSKAKEFDIGTKDLFQNLKIVELATLSVKPARPNKTLALASSILAGLVLALVGAFFISYLDDSIKSQEDVENILHVPFLGYIPNIKSTSVVERDLQAHLHPTSSSAEGFRTLRAAISLIRNSERMKVIAVTSTIPSEGKSLVASNLAIVTAQTGLRTVLVDADLRRPSVHKAFQLQSLTGLTSYLTERVSSIGDITHSSVVANLDIICCGSTPSNPSELISSRRMVQFLEELSKRYDRIILDCPPVSAVADPLVVGAMADGIVFVTKFNKIRKGHAVRSIQRIQDSGINIIGLVLNDIDFEGKDSYYYSYHYYQNRYYASHYSGKIADSAAVTPPVDSVS